MPASASSSWSPRHAQGGFQTTRKPAPDDPADSLTTPEAIERFINDAFETDDRGYIAHAIGVVARAKGMANEASHAGLARDALYRAFNEEGNPSLKSTIAVLKSIGLAISVRSISDDEPK